MTLPQLAWGGYTTSSTCQAENMNMSVNCYGPNLTSCTASMNGRIVCSGPKLTQCNFTGMNGNAVCVGGQTAPTCSFAGGSNQCIPMTYAEGMPQCSALTNSSIVPCTPAQLQNYAEQVAQNPHLIQTLQLKKQTLIQAAGKTLEQAVAKRNAIDEGINCVYASQQALSTYSDLTAIQGNFATLKQSLQQAATAAGNQVTATSRALQQAEEYFSTNNP